MTTAFNPAAFPAKRAALAGAVALSTLALPFLAAAQDAMAFAEVDQNVDGVISQDEFLGAYPNSTTDVFVAGDVDGDTVLTQAEYEAMATAMQ